MKFTEKWLREWVNPNITTAQLAEQLTMAGLEVDSVTQLADDFSGVVVGNIVECARHPNADKLSVCKVDIGTGDLQPIVCGGDNVRVGLRVALATVGAVLPGDFKIKKSKLRGEPSHGMICSAKELGIADPHATPKGIMELADDAPLGMDLRDYMQLDDCVFDIELTPNRGDCASVKGIACEVGVLNHLPVQSVPVAPIASRIADVLCVTVDNAKACPRYTGRIVKGIDTAAQTPMWMSLRLEQSGIRCIHPVVDVCNYVMLELGQPMHGFDLAKLDSKLVVRSAKKGEKIKLLDEQEVSLQPADLVIADNTAARAIAGVMGGFDSGVTDATQDVFLESAFFDPVCVSLTARRLGVTSDSSYRFERGVDFNLQIPALERATQLLLEIAGGQAGPVIEVVDKTALPDIEPIKLRRGRIASVLGIEISDADVQRILRDLGMRVETDGLGWIVNVPSQRFDIRYEIDLIEEIARLYGYNNIPIKNLEAPLNITLSKNQKVMDARIADFLVDAGYSEVITYSFVEETLQQLIQPHVAAVSVQNPISNDMSVMRTSIWPGLLETMRYNQNRQLERHRLFEMGLCFHQVGNEITQEPYLGLLAAGAHSKEQWGEKTRSVDFFDLKGVLEQLCQLTHAAPLCFKPGTFSSLHPGKSADLYQNDQCVGYVGVLHPGCVKKLGLRQAPVLLHIKLAAFAPHYNSQFEPVSKFPFVRRDLALVVDETITAQQILQLVENKTDNILNKAWIFDLYQGEGIEKGKKSIALGLTFQDPSRTLIDADIDSAIQGIIKALKEDLKATLRT